MTMFFAKKLNKKGFTLAELLIVVAIIAILVAIAVPVFTGEMNKARLGVHRSNARNLKSMAVATILADRQFEAKYDETTKPDFEVEGTYNFGTEEFTISSIEPVASIDNPKMYCGDSASPTNEFGSADGEKAIGKITLDGEVYYKVEITAQDLDKEVTWG